MIDLQHKILKSIKDNLDDITSFFEDKDKIERIMGETKTIASWDRNARTLMYQSITEDILNKYDINEIVKSFIAFDLSKEESIDINVFKAGAHEYYLFLKKVYDIYLLDQVYYLLTSDIDFDSFKIAKPFKTGSNYEKINFDISFSQISFNRDNEDVDIRLYNIKEHYVELIRNLLQNKKYLMRKARLNEYLSKGCEKTDNYYIWQLYFTLNSLSKNTKSKKKKTSKENDEMQLVLKNFKI